MAAGDGRIGGAHFELTVNAQAFNTSLVEAEAQAKKTTETIAEGQKTVSQSIKESTQSARDFRQAMGGIVGIAGSVVGVLTTAVALFQKLAEVMEDGSKRAERFAEQGLKRVADSVEADLEKTREQILKVQSELAQDLEDQTILNLSPIYTLFFGGRSRIQIEQELRALKETETSLSKQRNAQRLREQEEEDKKRAKQEADANIKALFEQEQRRQESWRQAEVWKRDADKSEFDAFVKMERDRQNVLIESAKAVREANSKEAQNAFDEFVKYDQERQKVLIEAARARIDEENKLQKLKMDNARRLADYQRSLTQGFGVGDVASSDLSALVDAMKQVTANQISSRD